MQLKEEVPYDETYAILKRVAAGEFVFLDYKNGVRIGGAYGLLSITYHQVGPQIEIKYKQGGKQFIHRASQSVGVRKGMTIDLSISML